MTIERRMPACRSPGILGFALCVLAATAVWSASPRSRAEAPPGLASSNTVGSGNVWLRLGAMADFRTQPVHRDRLRALADTVYASGVDSLLGEGDFYRRDLRAVPAFGLTVGLAEFLDVEVMLSPWDGEKIGATVGQLKWTFPGNDRIRLFGVAAFVGATLSTEEDIYSRGETTPGFDPLPHYGFALDADFVKLSVRWPVKAYLDYRSLDEVALARAFEQHRLQAGFEWKGSRSGAHFRWSGRWYRPLPTRFDPDPGSAFLPLRHEIGLGYRWLWADRFRFAAEASFDPLAPLGFAEDEARRPPQARFQVETPLFGHETQAEAVRSLLFAEAERRRYRKSAEAKRAGLALAADTAGTSQARRLPASLGAFALEPEGDAKKGRDALEQALREADAQALERRKRVREELRQIEELLE